MKGNLVVIDGKNYDEYTVNTGTQTATIQEYIPTEQEILEKNNEQRASELRKIISDKKLLDMDCTIEQNELKGLLGL